MDHCRHLAVLPDLSLDDSVGVFRFSSHPHPGAGLHCCFRRRVPLRVHHLAGLPRRTRAEESVDCLRHPVHLAPANYLSFTPFLISFAAYLLGLRALLVTAALSFAGLVLAGWWSGSVDAVLSLGIAMALVFIVNLMVTQMMRAGQSAEHMRVELARAEERVKLSRDVHDLLGHSLTVVKLKSELAEKLLDAEPARAKKELQRSARSRRKLLRGFVQQLRACEEPA